MSDLLAVRLGVKMRLLSLWLLLTVLLAPTLCADLISAKAALEAKTGQAAPGGEVLLRVSFEVDKGFHAYHKDNPGYSKPLKIEFSELSGLTQVGETKWPAYHVAHPDEKDLAWEEWELAGAFELVLTYKVPSDAKGKLTVRGTYEAQVCDEKGCTDRKGDLLATIDVAVAVQPPTSAGGPTAEDLKRIEEKIDALEKGGTSNRKDLAAIKKTLEELAIAASRAEPSTSTEVSRKDSHGFYEDFDYALGEAKKQAKLILVDFNGEY